MKWLLELLLAFIPPVEMVAFFSVTREEASALCTFNRSYHSYLRELEQVYFGESIRQSLEETDTLYKAWDNLRDAKTETLDVSCRRTALFRLRGLIGHEAFYNGVMPPAVPVWRFARVEQ